MCVDGNADADAHMDAEGTPINVLNPNICNKTPENYTQIYAVRKLVPKCAYLSRTEIRLTRVTIVC